MKTVDELTQEELEELRSRYYHQCLDDGSLLEIFGEEVEEEDVPMDLIKTHYGGTYFVEEDFWCNLKD